MKCKDIYEWPESYGDPEWFIHDRFGMFIHFGLFSVAARHEWVMTLEQIGAEGYKKYFDNFNPDFFDARKWAKEAKEAGFQYAVLTANIMKVLRFGIRSFRIIRLQIQNLAVIL